LAESAEKRRRQQPRPLAQVTEEQSHVPGFLTITRFGVRKRSIVSEAQYAMISKPVAPAFNAAQPIDTDNRIQAQFV
jgi:hypothetical protein